MAILRWNHLNQGQMAANALSRNRTKAIIQRFLRIFLSYLCKCLNLSAVGLVTFWDFYIAAIKSSEMKEIAIFPLRQVKLSHPVERRRIYRPSVFLRFRVSRQADPWKHLVSKDLVETTGLEPVTSCVWRNTGIIAQVIVIAQPFGPQSFAGAESAEAVWTFDFYSNCAPDK